MLIPVKNVTGEQVGEVELSDSVFAAPVNKPLMHQALVRQLANARLGTHDTKERWEVSGGGKKPWRQKGTGRARQGSTRAPQWIGGGTVFGPTPRKYTQSLNKKMQRAALRSALTVKAAAGQIVVVDALTFETPKTKQMMQVLNRLGASERSVLMVLAAKNETVWRSANNLPTVKTLISGYINVRDLLGHETLLLSRDAVSHIELWLGDDTTSLDGPNLDLPDLDLAAAEDRVEPETPVTEGDATPVEAVDSDVASASEAEE